MSEVMTADAAPADRAAYLPMAEIDRILRDNPVRRELIPLECRSSWLVPVTSAGREGAGARLFLAGFVYPVSGIAGQPHRVGRPRYHWAIDPATGRLVELADCRFRDFAAEVASAPEIGTLTAEMLPARTVPELERFRGEMLAAYDKVLPIAFTPPAQLDAAAHEAVHRLHALLRRGIEPFLEPFYRALNPRFFDWLDSF